MYGSDPAAEEMSHENDGASAETEPMSDDLVPEAPEQDEDVLDERKPQHMRKVDFQKVLVVVVYDSSHHQQISQQIVVVVYLIINPYIYTTHTTDLSDATVSSS